MKFSQSNLSPIAKDKAVAERIRGQGRRSRRRFTLDPDEYRDTIETRWAITNSRMNTLPTFCGWGVGEFTKNPAAVKNVPVGLVKRIQKFGGPVELIREVRSSQLVNRACHVAEWLGSTVNG